MTRIRRWWAGIKREPEWLGPVLAVSILLLLTLIFSGCAKRVAPGRFDIVHGDGWAYRRLNDGEFAVTAVDSRTRQEVLETIGCESTYDCQVYLTDVQTFVVLVRKKP